MPWDTSSRKSELPPDWEQIRAKVKARAGGRCEWRLPSGSRCPRDGTDCDHPTDRWNHKWTSLRWLCSRHHDKKSSREGLAARLTTKAAGVRKQPPHPGLRKRQ